MPVKQKRVTSPGVRFQINDTYEDLTKFSPEKSLVVHIRKNAGRDNKGRVSQRHRGGGAKKLYRLIDFKRDKDNITARIEGLEYDPNRNVRIALVKYDDGEKRYILAPLGMAVDQKIMSGPEAEIALGNSLPIKNIPVGTVVHNVELTPGRGGQLARSAGVSIMIVAKEGEYAILKMPSGEQRLVHITCRATVGQLGNPDAKNIKLGKAGETRHRGRRPKVRGTVMNPCDHPHGGGEGKSGVGRPSPLTPWGKPTLGKKTRRRHSRFILTRRK